MNFLLIPNIVVFDHFQCAIITHAWVPETVKSFGTYYENGNANYSHSQAHAQEPGTEAMCKTSSIILSVASHQIFPPWLGKGILCTSKDPT